MVSLIVDGGPDFNPHHLKNILAFGRLWQDLKLDCLMLTTHAPGQSAYNPLEHAWSVMANALAGVTFANHLPNEYPAEEQDISDDAKLRKEAVVFDRALDELCGYWSGKTFDGFPVRATKVRCLDPVQKYSDDSRLDEYTKSSMKNLKGNDDLKELHALHKLLCKHLIRTTYHCLFVKCTLPACQHCSNSPIKAKRFIGFLR